MTNHILAQDFGKTLTVLLPARNEEAAIGPLIEGIQNLMPTCNILVADSSDDATAKIAEEAGAEVLRFKPLGKGYAVRKALKHITTPYVVMADADGTYPPLDIFKVYAQCWLHRNFDHLVVGVRRFKEKGSMTLTNKFGNKALSYWASLLYGVNIPDVCSGLWAGTTFALESLELSSNGFTLEAELFAKSVKKNYVIIHVPIRYLARPSHSKPKLKVRDGFKIGMCLLQERFK